MNYKRSIAIIEPHYDDSWLNLGGFILLNPTTFFKILTITKCDVWNYINHTKELERILPNVKTHALNYNSISIPGDIKSNVLKHGDIKKMIESEMKQKGIPDYLKLFFHNNNLDHLGVVLEHVDRFIEDTDEVYIPLGIYHPMHIVVSNFRLSPRTLRYSEYPYKFYPSEQITLRNKRRRFKKHVVDISSVLKKKVKIFKSVYSTQQYILSNPGCSTKWESLSIEEYYEEVEGGA